MLAETLRKLLGLMHRGAVKRQVKISVEGLIERRVPGTRITGSLTLSQLKEATYWTPVIWGASISDSNVLILMLSMLGPRGVDCGGGERVRPKAVG